MKGSTAGEAHSSGHLIRQFLVVIRDVRLLRLRQEGGGGEKHVRLLSASPQQPYMYFALSPGLGLQGSLPGAGTRLEAGPMLVVEDSSGGHGLGKRCKAKGSKGQAPVVRTPCVRISH